MAQKGPYFETRTLYPAGDACVMIFHIVRPPYFRS